MGCEDSTEKKHITSHRFQRSSLFTDCSDIKGKVASSACAVEEHVTNFEYYTGSMESCIKTCLQNNINMPVFHIFV